MKIFYGGEDDVTKMIARRLASDIASEISISNVMLEDIGIRERGGAILRKLPQIVAFGKKYPIVFVFDSDGDCVLEILRKSCPNGWDNTFATLNIAIDEGESWLIADKKDFAKYFDINLSDIRGIHNSQEMSFPYKTSLYIMNELVPKSGKKDVRDNMSCTARGRKPSTYNVRWKSYIDSKWNIETAMKNSESLSRAVWRIRKKLRCYIECEQARGV